MNLIVLLSVFFLASCAGRKAPRIKPPKSQQPVDNVWEPGVENVPEIEARDLPADSDVHEEQVEKKKPIPPVIGIVVEGAGLESFVALGFMQELAKEGIQPKKILGVGWGCWIALSWALESSSNQAEWQSFKWSTWKFLGLEKSFISRITGSKASYEDFANEMKVWLPKGEFNEYALDVDCPSLSLAKGRAELQSSQQLGVYRALWNQLQIPLFNLPNPETKNIMSLSGLAAQAVAMDEYDNFSTARGSSEKIDFWIHLQSSPSDLLSGDDAWLSAAFLRAEVARESWYRTRQGRWVMKMPLYREVSVNEKRALDFSERRALLLKGRDLGRRWIEGNWYQNNLAPAFTTPDK